MTDTRMADISEHQSTFDARAYIGGGHSCIIIRAHNGYRVDNKWPGRRDYVRQYPFTAVGYYGYMVADRNPQDQAMALLNAVGTLRPNEFLILDHEEGGGNQTPRAEEWFRVVDNAQGFPAMLYAGQYFCRDHLGGWGRWAARPRWLAAYQSSEPRDPHDLWQYSSSARFAGLPGNVDASLFHGTEAQFKAMARRGSRVEPPPGRGADMAVLGGTTAVQNKDGRMEEFTVRGTTVWHRYQTKPNGGWSDWISMGAP